MRHRVSTLALAAGMLALAACGGGAPDPAEMEFGTPQQMMANHVQPTADIYWMAVRYESELVDGEVVQRDIKPETDADWQQLVDAARQLQVLGEALKSPAYSADRGEDWGVFSQGLVDVSARAEAAAQAKDVDAVFETGGTIYNVCTACHQMYPPANLPAGVSGEDLAADDPA